MKYKNIVLIGMPGSGKSTIGPLLAKELGFNFIDIDNYMADLFKKKPSMLYREKGERKFMNIERDAMLSVPHLSRHVISPPGSIVYYDDVMKYFRKDLKSFFAHLFIEPENMKMREELVWKGNKTKKQVYDERLMLYKSYANMEFLIEGMNPKHASSLIASELKKSYL